MEYKLIFTEKAETELQELLEYYRSVNSETLLSFGFDVGDAMNKVKNNPEIYRVRYSGIRRFNFKIFPVMFLYRIQNNEVIILHAWHQSSRSASR
jgi:plasmid stabilization system protein ParE